MRRAAGRVLEDIDQIHAYPRPIESDNKLVGVEAIETGGLKRIADLVECLAQGSPRPLFRRLAPEQSDQPLTALFLSLGQRQISEQGLGLAAQKLDFMIADMQ